MTIRMCLLSEVIAAVVVTLAVAGGARAETFDQALAAAWQNNPNMRAARADQRAAKSDLATAKNRRYPSLSLKAQLARNHTTGTMTLSEPSDDFSADLNQASVALRLEQPIYQGGRLSARIDENREALLASRSQTNVSGTEVLLNAAEAYLDTLTARKLVQVQDDNVNVIKHQLDGAREALQHGEGTQTDVAQAQSRLQAAIAQRIRAQSELAQRRALYRTVIGHPPSRLSMPEKLPPLPATLDQAKALAGQNYRVQAAGHNALAADSKTDVARAARMPRISLFAEVSRAHDPQYGFQHLNDEAVGLSLSLPIWNGGAIRSKTAAARERANAARLEASAAMDRAVQNIVAAWHDYVASKAALGAEKTRLAAARTAADGVAAQHRHGLRTLLDVLNAEQEVRNARAAIIQARRDRIVAAYQLLAVTGQLSAAQLDLAAAGAMGGAQ